MYFYVPFLLFYGIERGMIHIVQHSDHIHLIKKAVTKKGGLWADLGSGDGAFTLALRDLAGDKSEIYSVDKDNNRLQRQKENFDTMFPDTTIHFLHADFTKALNLPLLDGIVMANSLHYVKDQVVFLQKIKNYLKPKGELILVEYNTNSGNPWVPYPVSFEKFIELSQESGFQEPRLLEKVPSTYWNEMYAAEAVV